MANKLDQLRRFTTVVADTGDIEAMQKYQPEDATTNPSLILKAAQLPSYNALIEDAISYAKTQSDDKKQRVEAACDMRSISVRKF